MGVNDKVFDSTEAENDSDSNEFGTAMSLVENTLEAPPVIVLGISKGRPVCSAVKEGTAGIKGFGTGSGTADISALGFSMSWLLSLDVVSSPFPGVTKCVE